MLNAGRIRVLMRIIKLFGRRRLPLVIAIFIGLAAFIRFRIVSLYSQISDEIYERHSEPALSDVVISEAAKRQPKQGGLFCWVMTASIFHQTRLPAINETWLNKCDGSHFFTDSETHLNENTPYHTIFSDLPTPYSQLFWKSRLAIYYIYNQVSPDFDWYYKADDDTYAVIENLKEFLSPYNPEEPFYFGFRIRGKGIYAYNSGGSGYILSRAAMKVFADDLFHDHRSCLFHEWEDIGIGRCLSLKGIYTQDTRDFKNRQRFLPFRPERHYTGEIAQSFLVDPKEYIGADVFHENLIAFHHLRPAEIHLMHAMIYKLSPKIFGNQKPE